MLRSLSYGRTEGFKEIPVEVLKLFQDMLVTGETTDYAYEIVQAGLKGNIDFSKEFNRKAYEFAIEKHKYLKKRAKAKREIFIEFAPIEDSVPPKGGVHIDLLNEKSSLQVTDCYEELLDVEEFQYALESLKNLNVEFQIDFGIDIFQCLKQSLQGVPDAIRKLRKLCKNYELVGENIEILLKSGKNLLELI